MLINPLILADAVMQISHKWALILFSCPIRIWCITENQIIKRDKEPIDYSNWLILGKRCKYWDYPARRSGFLLPYWVPHGSFSLQIYSIISAWLFSLFVFEFLLTWLCTASYCSQNRFLDTSKGLKRHPLTTFSPFGRPSVSLNDADLVKDKMLIDCGEEQDCVLGKFCMPFLPLALTNSKIMLLICA